MGQKGEGGEHGLAGATKNDHVWQGAGPRHASAKDRHKTPLTKPPS